MPRPTAEGAQGFTPQIFVWQHKTQPHVSAHPSRSFSRVPGWREDGSSGHPHAQRPSLPLPAAVPRGSAGSSGHPSPRDRDLGLPRGVLARPAPPAPSMAAPRSGMAPGTASSARTKHGRARPCEGTARLQDGASPRCCVRTDPKMAASPPPHVTARIQDAFSSHALPTCPASRPAAAGGVCPHQRWRSEAPPVIRLLAPRSSPRFVGVDGRDGGGRAGVRVGPLREARCQRLPHPAAHFQPRVQVRGREGPGIALARPSPRLPLPALPAGLRPQLGRGKRVLAPSGAWGSRGLWPQASQACSLRPSPPPAAVLGDSSRLFRA